MEEARQQAEANGFTINITTEEKCQPLRLRQAALHNCQLVEKLKTEDTITWVLEYGRIEGDIDWLKTLRTVSPR